MKKKRLAKNTLSSLVFQITTLVCGFVLPRLILREYGSSVNGLVNSITQFLNIIAFLELGVGAVVQSSLYKPLAEKDFNSASRIVVSAAKFFKKLALILLVYVVFLLIAYPQITREFDHLYTATLIVVMCVSSFAQYYFGMVDRLLLTADQRGYIQYNAQTITLILNTVACVFLMKLGATIHTVKLTTSLIYLARPLVLRWYVNRHYNLNRRIKYDGEPIKQKWNGVAQHVSAVVLDSTATIVLTTFATLSDVSIYTVYHQVVVGIKNLFLSMTNGIQALLGELWAKQEVAELRKTFDWTEWVIHTGTVLIFGCTAVLIIPFVQVYIAGVQDAEYIKPLFSILLVVGHAIHCLRLPYNIVILAAGHYKQTQSNYIIAAVLNLGVSILAVHFWGLVGAALGTIVALTYQTIWMAHYNAKYLIKRSPVHVIKQWGVNGVTFVLGYVLSSFFHMSEVSYIAWINLAIKVVLVWFVVVIFVNFVAYREKVTHVAGFIKRRKC